MIGRLSELNVLNNLYQKNNFEFLVLYGRRRVGKTTLLQEFASDKELIFFASQEKNDSLNLYDFSKMVQRFFTGSFIAPFTNWPDAFAYISRQSTVGKRIVLIIDEFPFLAKANPSVKSALQHEIDHEWKKRNILLILCGSSVSFMENDVMDYESLLYGRITAHMELLPFDYYEAADFFPDYSEKDKTLAYEILGGIPRYLEMFDDRKSIRDNIRDSILSGDSFLNDEPEIMIHTELREVNVYNSILEAISNGYNTVTSIQDRIHEDRTKISKYLITLQNLKIVNRIAPYNTPVKAVYEIADLYYRFWYKYLFSNKSYYTLLGKEDAADEIMRDLPSLMGHEFEEICRQYITRKSKLHSLPFIPASVGRWWGNNPAIKAQDDVDVLAVSKTGDEALFCECKFTSRPMPMAEYDDLITAAQAFPSIRKKHLMFISASGFTEPVIRQAAEDHAALLTIRDLYLP